MGGKRIKIDANLQLKCAKRYFSDGDWISRLPDEILVDILSLLSLKEAARTAVLSSRWINLWKHTPSLDLAADQSLLDKFYRQGELLETEKPKYVEWVNSVIQSHESLTLKEFRIRFHLDKSSGNAITRWLEFAFSRQVERLELDLRNNRCDLSKYYWFPEEFLALSNCTAPKLLPPPNIFKSLKELSFKGIHLGGGVIEFFLHNCPLVERLVIDQAHNISNLEVRGPSLRLKHLEVVHCVSLESLKVSVPNLTSLEVTESGGLLLEYVPMLVELTVTFRHYDNNIFVKRLIRELSFCVSQLEVLCLTLVGTLETYELCNFPEMPKLKKLVIKYARNQSIAGPIALLRASPYLEEFFLKYGWIDLPNKDREMKDPITRSPHHHLKLFEFCGYYGRVRDIELISYISDNCVVLEKIIIDPVWRMVNGLCEEQTARKNAKEQLEQRVPQHVELVIL